jgi:hypothetical protein
MTQEASSCRHGSRRGATSSSPGYRALLEHDGEITVVARWLVEVERERRSLDWKPTARKLTKREIKRWSAN